MRKPLQRAATEGDLTWIQAAPNLSAWRSARAVRAGAQNPQLGDHAATRVPAFGGLANSRPIAGVIEVLLGFANVARRRLRRGKFSDDGGSLVRGIVVDDENLEVFARELLRDEPASVCRTALRTLVNNFLPRE
jgi:hypothetical protein